MDPIGQALVGADAWYQSQVLHQAAHPTVPEHPQLEPQHIIPIDERIYHGLEPVPFGPPMLESQTPTVVLTEKKLVNNNTTPVEHTAGDSLPPIVCNESWLHGPLIANLPHKCKKTETINAKSKKVWVKTVKCGFTDCSIVFKKAQDFNRHYKTVHIRMADQPKLDCTVEGCHRVGEEGFTRKDNLIQHIRDVHGEDIPKNPVRFNGSMESYGYGPRKPLVKGYIKQAQINMEG